jgi:hypothetical protein
VNNSTQGFRDNFISIKNNLDTSKTELDDLQSKVIVKSALSGKTLDNNMANVLISNASIKGFRQPMHNLGSNINDTLLIDVTKGDVQYGTITGDTTLSFAGWAPSGTLCSVQLNLTIATNPDGYHIPYVLYFPSSRFNSQVVLTSGMDATVSLLENYGASGNPAAGATVTNQISAPAGVTELQLKFSTVNCGITLSVQPLNRNLKASFINLRTPIPTGAPGDGPGAICMDYSMVYVCVGTYDGSTPIWGRLGGDNGSIWALS